MHRSILEDSFFPEELKMQSIHILSRCYDSKHSETGSIAIMTLMIDTVVNHSQNEKQIINTVAAEFYEDTLSKNINEKKTFLRKLFYKCKGKSDLISELPECIKDEIHKSDLFKPNEKKRMILDDFDNYLEKKDSGDLDSSLEDWIIDYIMESLNSQEEVAAKKEVLKTIISKTRK